MQVSSKLEKCHVISLLHGQRVKCQLSEGGKKTHTRPFFFVGKNTFINKRTVV